MFSKAVGKEPISAGRLGYFRARLKNRLHAIVFDEFVRLEKTSGLTRRQLAARIGKKAEQITRWLGAPGNWTLDTVSDLLLAMNAEPTFQLAHFSQTQSAPQRQWTSTLVIRADLFGACRDATRIETDSNWDAGMPLHFQCQVWNTPSGDFSTASIVGPLEDDRTVHNQPEYDETSFAP